MKRRKFLLNSLAVGMGTTVPSFIMANGLIRNPSGEKRLISDSPQSLMTPVLTRSYNNARTCTNTQEKILTAPNVGTRGIRRLFNLPTPGDKRGCEAQPLIVPKIMVADGTTHDLVILATMANTVLAYDANDGKLIWDLKLGNPVKSFTGMDQWMVNDNWGILSTPVIDPTTNILYCDSWSSTDGSLDKAIHAVYAVNIKTGKVSKGPLSLEGVSFEPGFGLPVQKFVSVQRKQRCGLLLTSVNGVKTIFLGCGTVSETNNMARGWIIAIDLKSFKIAATFATAARYSGGGIWQAGQGLVADSKGFIYCMTGNGAFDGKTEWGECFLKLKYIPPAGTANASLRVIDWWSPFSDSGRAGLDPTLPNTTEGGDNGPTNNGEFTDQDLGSGGPVCIEEFGVVAGAGKDGILYVTNMNNMGKTANKDFADPQKNYAKLKIVPQWFTFYPGNGISSAPQDITQIDKYYFNLTHHQHSTPVVYDSPIHGKMMFTWGENGNLRAWSMNHDGNLTYLASSNEIASPDSANNDHHGGMPGGMLSLSCNGTIANTGVLWALVPRGDANRDHTPGILYCYDPDNFTTLANGDKALRVLWTSADWNINFTHPKFNVPVVSGGKIFVPTYDGRVDVYGLA